MTRLAAGLLMYRIRGDFPNAEYFLVHPGGPYFRRKDAGYWTIPKGMPENDEDLLSTALREFYEETGIVPAPPFHPLGAITQKGGKSVHGWGFEGDWSPESGIVCNTFTLEWPPRSGKKVQFPEVDRAEWFDYPSATRLIIPEQIPFLERTRAIIEKIKNHPSSA